MVTLPPAAVVMALLFMLMGRVGAVPVTVGAANPHWGEALPVHPRGVHQGVCRDGQIGEA